MPESHRRRKPAGQSPWANWSPRRKRIWAIRFAIVAVGCWLAWAIVANTASDSFAERDPTTALSWSENPTALLRLAEERLEQGIKTKDPQPAAEFAARALQDAPLETGALRVLGAAAELGGDQARTESLFRLAAERTRRDPVVNIWWFFHLSRAARFVEALDFADALLRTRPGRRDTIGPTLLAYALDETALPALTARLATNPPWRAWYMTEVGKQTKNPGVAFALFDALKKAGAPPTLAELRPHLDALIQAGLFEQAYLTWIHHLPDDRQGRLGLAYNGGFDYGITDLPFDWVVSGVAGATTELLAGEGPDEDAAIAIEFSGRRVAYRHVSKLLMLPPGRYRLSVSGRADALTAVRGLIWRVTCAEGEKHQVGVTAPIVGTFGWQDFEAIIEVPQQDCRGQWLTLLLDARAALEQQVSGKVWFDDIKVERAPAVRPQAAR